MPKTKTMPKQKTAKESGPRPPVPEPDPKGPQEQRPTVIVYKGDGDYKRWLQELAVYSRQSVAMVIDLSVIDFARKIGFTKQAPPRNPPRA